MKRKKKITVTFLAGYYEPDIAADTHLNTSLCNGLEQLGYDIHAVVPFPSRGISKKIIEKYAKIPLEVNEYGVTIHRVGKSKYKKNLFFRAIDLLWKTFKIYRMAKKIESDVYIIMSTPPFLGFLALFLPKKSLKIFRLEDIFPDTLVKADILSSKGVIFKILNKLEMLVYYSNDRIVAISKDMERELRNRRVDKNKLSVIYNWIDEKKCVPIEKKDNYLFERLGIDKRKFIVLYAGNMGKMQNLDTIVMAAKELSDNQNIFFAIVGDGTEKNRIIDKIKSLNLRNIKIFPMQPVEEVSYVYSLGDVGLVSLQEGVSKMALPSKTWSIMSASRPVICEIDEYSELNATLKLNHCGLCVYPGDYHSMVNAIEQMYGDRTFAIKMGKEGRKFIEDYMTERKGIQLFDQLIIKFGFKR